jgi:hypothetical protein
MSAARLLRMSRNGRKWASHNSSSNPFGNYSGVLEGLPEEEKATRVEP